MAETESLIRFAGAVQSPGAGAGAGQSDGNRVIVLAGRAGSVQIGQLGREMTARDMRAAYGS